jgi:hypothetical protein
MATQPQRTPAPAPASTAYAIDDRPDPEVTPIVFVGGTGRSGTHIVGRLYGRHERLFTMPVECRFHVSERGFPGLLAGEVTKGQFLRRLRGFWWRGRQTGRVRGMFKHLPRERFDAAVERFDGRFDEDEAAACRELFLDLLWPEAVAIGASGVVEQSCDSIAAAPTLTRLFPEARFVHVVRDGRDASASRVSQTRGLITPRTRRGGLRWWERRIRAIDAGADAIPEEQYMEIALEELLVKPQRRAVRRLSKFVTGGANVRMRRFARKRMTRDAANAERWRDGLSKRRQERLAHRYEEIVAGLEADGIRCAPLLRRTLEGGWHPEAAAGKGGPS